MAEREIGRTPPGLTRLGMSRTALQAAVEEELRAREVEQAEAIAEAIAEVMSLNNEELLRQLSASR